jgi:hypothetical protein
MYQTKNMTLHRLDVYPSNIKGDEKLLSWVDPLASPFFITRLMNMTGG